MKLFLSREKVILFAPALIVLLVFFIPISSTMKSIFWVLSLFALSFTPYYRHYLYDTFNTLWARAALILFLYIVIASLWSEAPFSMRFSVIDKYSKLIFLPIFAVGFIQPRTRRWVLNTFISAMMLTCILSFLKSKNILVWDSHDPGEVFYNHIVTGVMVSLAVYFSGIMLIQIGVKQRLTLFYLSMVLLGSYQLFFINSGRSGYIAYTILMILLILQNFSLKKALLGVTLFLGMLISVYNLSPVMQNRAHDIIDSIKFLQHNQVVYSSLSLRVQFYEYAYSLFKEHPIRGIGTGGFKYRFSKDQPVPSWGPKLNEPHSQYWLTLVEQGLIGLILLLFFLGSLFVSALQLKEMKPFLIGILCAFCVLSFSDTIFCYSTLGYLLIIFSALCFGELIENWSCDRTAFIKKRPQMMKMMNRPIS